MGSLPSGTSHRPTDRNGLRLAECTRLAWLLVASAVLALPACSQEQKPAVRLDFTDAAAVSQWQPTHDVSRIEAVPGGMLVRISGSDPYIMGPPVDPPQGTELWLRVRLLSEAGGTLQVFFFRAFPTEEHSVRVSVPAKRWVEVAMPAPPMERGTRLRIDPPGTSGSCTIAWLELAPRAVPTLPVWSKPRVPSTASAYRVKSGDVMFAHERGRLNGFSVVVSGYLMATGWSRAPVAYETNNRVRWFDLSSGGNVRVQPLREGLVVTCRAVDPDGAVWQVRQTYEPLASPGGVRVTQSVRISRDRTIYFLPMLALFPGNGSFGTARERGLLAGVEYLDPRDTSSSEADLRGPQAQRLVPESTKITFPLMVMQARKRYIAVIWERNPWLAAAYDTPDRSFGSGANAMALIVPGSDGTNRSEGKLLPYSGYPVRAGTQLTARAVILGGVGDSVLPAVERYVRDHPLPPVPPTGMDRKAYARWTAHGWLDSKIREGARYRHAYWPGFAGFAPQPAADVAAWLEWLAVTCSDPELEQRLKAQVREVLNITDPTTRNSSGVSHVRYPVVPLLFGDVEGAAEHARREGRELLARFEPDGTILYRPTGGTDYGRTHWEKHANGLTAPVVAQILENALYAGDRDLLRQGIERLRALDRYTNSAPRGAQTWEVPLHTPDILASAHLVKAYVLGYEATGDPHFLKMARHWAWTGVPFVYLTPPTDEPVGLYATTPVLGATNWVAPNWIGLPVQWCGLVYSAALYRLARYDTIGPWKRLADGITASGIQQSWPASDSDLQGLLPDSFVFKSQTRNPVAINPGTVQANAIHLYGGPHIYDYHCFRGAGVTVHAPGLLSDRVEKAGQVSFAVQGWVPGSYYVLLHGIGPEAQVRVNGQIVPLARAYRYDREARRLVLQVSGSPRISISQ